MKIISNETRKLIIECIDLFEANYRSVVIELGMNFTSPVKLKPDHMEQWMKTYYPKLVKSNIIMDDRFFCPDGLKPEWGVGNDGIFTKFEYCNFLYRLAELTVDNSVPKNEETNLVIECILMLEPYINYFAAKANEGKALSLGVGDLNLWNKEYYIKLVASNLIPDDVFFDKSGRSKNLGIGNDGKFQGTELLHFLYECYLYLLKKSPK